MFEFYIPLWIAMIFNIYCFVNVVKKTNKILFQNQDLRNVQILKYYPFILIFCSIFGTINIILSLFKKNLMGLTCLNVFFLNLQGLFNAIVYCQTPIVKKILKNKLCNSIPFCIDLNENSKEEEKEFKEGHSDFGKEEKQFEMENKL